MWQHSIYPCGLSVLLVSSHPVPTAPLLVNRKTTLPPCPPISSNFLDIIWFWPQFAGRLVWILPMPKAEVFLSTFKDNFMAKIQTEQKISVQAGSLCDFWERKRECPSRTAFLLRLSVRCSRLKQWRSARLCGRLVCSLLSRSAINLWLQFLRRELWETPLASHSLLRLTRISDSLHARYFSVWHSVRISPGRSVHQEALV